ncbi:MAG: hypothetical protein NTW67_04515 [Candidatus Woesearchaeota archaeon]|nr:hypothetical protein [Candidatus Woesearchaeota archaeon]
MYLDEVIFMGEQYLKEDVDRLKKELMAIRRRRVISEAKINFLEEENELEGACHIGGEPEGVFRQRCESICKLCKQTVNYFQQEIKAYNGYMNASWAYETGMNKPS